MNTIGEEMKDLENEIANFESNKNQGILTGHRLQAKHIELNKKLSDIYMDMGSKKNRKVREIEIDEGLAWFIEQAQKLSNCRMQITKNYLFKAKDGFAVAEIIEIGNGKFNLVERQKAGPGRVSIIHRQEYDELSSVMNEAKIIVEKYEQ